MRYSFRRAVFVPVSLSVIAVAAGLTISGWFIASIPFIWLGAICASPNLNLADGCLAYIAMIIGVLASIVFEPLGVAILFGVVCGYYLSAAEIYLRARPVIDETEE